MQGSSIMYTKKNMGREKKSYSRGPGEEALLPIGFGVTAEGG